MRAESAAMMRSQNSASVAPEADRVAVEPADDRLLDVEQRVDEAPREVELFLQQRDVVLDLEAAVQVAAGAERAAGAGEHDDVGEPIAPQVLEQAQQLGLHLEADRIELVGRVQRDAQHLALALDQQELVAGVVHRRLRRAIRRLRGSARGSPSQRAAAPVSTARLAMRGIRAPCRGACSSLAAPPSTSGRPGSAESRSR